MNPNNSTKPADPRQACKQTAFTIPLQDGKELEFPEKVKFDLRVFHNHETYPIEAYLRTRKSDKALSFMLKIPDWQDIEHQAFDAVIKNVKTATSLPTLKGRFSGPSHK